MNTFKALIMIMVLGSGAAQAAGLPDFSLASGKATVVSCERALDEQILIAQPADYIVDPNKILAEKQGKLGFFAARKLRGVVKRLSKDQIRNEYQLETETLRLYEALYGSKSILTYFKQFPEGQLNPSQERRMNEVLTHKGIKNFLLAQGRYGEITRFQKFMGKFDYLNSTIWPKLLLLPFRLPTLKDLPMQPELLNKVIIDGLDLHINEVQIALGAQTKRDAYNAFTRYYGYASSVIFLAYGLYQAQQQYDQMRDQLVNKIIEDLKKLRTSVEVSADGIRKNEIEVAYQRALVEFRTIYGEDPTAEEQVELYQKISDGISQIVVQDSRTSAEVEKDLSDYLETHELAQ